MQLVEQHIIQRKDARYQAIDTAAFASKNLYNAALYEIRQSFIHDGKYLNYYEMDRRMQPHEAYKALPAKVAQQVLKQLHAAWVSYFEQCEAYQENPSRFLGHPKLPKYKHKTEGRNMLVYTIQAISRGKNGLKRRIIKPSMLAIAVKTQHRDVDQVRIVPRKGFYVVEVVYEYDPKPTAVDPALHAGVDMGIENLVALALNKPGFVPVVVHGRGLKSTNQFYNKRKAELQSKLGHTGTTKRMERMTNKRNRRIDHELHAVSRWVIDLLVAEGIGTLVIGKNDGWKQEANMSKRYNQHFCQIPHARFIQMLTYKAELAGIVVKLTEESYTSKASFLDRDALPTHGKTTGAKPTFSGKRIKRGLYRASDGTLINADINGASNIIRKVAPDAFGQRVVEDGEGKVQSLVVHPVRLSFPSRNQKVERMQ